MQIKTVLTLVLALVAFIALGTSACSMPNVKVSDPPVLGSLSPGNVNGSTSISSAIAAVKTATEMYDEKFVPPITELNDAGRNFSFLASTFVGCDEMRKPLTNAYRGNLQLQVALWKARETLAHSSPVSDKEKRIVATGDALVRNMQVVSALTLRDALPDSDGYLASCGGRILSQLSSGNANSMEKTLQQIEEAGHRMSIAKDEFTAALN